MTDYIETSLSAAYTTFQSTAITGDRVLLADGVYNNATRKSLTKNAAGLVTFGAQNVGGATITGEGIDLTSNNIIFRGFDIAMTTASANYIDINGTGCQFTRNKCHFANPGATRKWIRIRANNCLFDHNDCYSKANDDVLLLVFKTGETTTGVQILYNYFRDIVGMENDTECIRVGDSNRCTYMFNTEIAYNRFENISADDELISCKGSGLNIHHNTVKDCDSALTLRQCTDITVNANTFVNSGMRIYGKNHIITRNQIIENTHSQLKGHMTIGNGDAEELPVDTANAVYSRFKNCRIENNILAAGNATTNNIMQLGYDAARTLTPTGNTFRSNILTASTGVLTATIGNALWSDNTVANNILYTTGTATKGNMTTAGYTSTNPSLTQLADKSYRCALFVDTNKIGPLSP